MKDKIFKQQVLLKEISFKSGDLIDCVLVVDKKFDDNGNEVPSGYKVTTVLRKTDGNNVTETDSGKNYKKQKAKDDSQGVLNFGL